ncbi:MAG: hypothetical protein Q8904_04590 [Bacteroidota bacterium]|nr:hypothetical protein [Bacteroidota bacterium]
MKNNKNILIDEMSKELPFSVPENYFNQFALQIEEQIGFKRSITRKLFRPWMYMAAMFVGILVADQVFYSINQNNAARSAENYESYVLSQVDETSVADLYVEEPSNSK